VWGAVNAHENGCNSIEDDDEAISILEKYVSEESFEFYCNLAIEELSATYEDYSY
jgi:hypothetical protein